MQGKILKDNRSSYNLIAHDHYVPPSPPFGPAPRHAYIDPRGDYGTPRADVRVHANSGTEKEPVGWNKANDREDQTMMRGQSPRRQEPGYHVASDVRFTNDDIGHENHVPFSPLYRPGHGNPVDSRYTSHQGNGQQTGVGRDSQGHTQLAEGGETSQRHRDVKGSLGATIGQINHVPVSPLYRPGQGRGLAMADPRYGSPNRRRPGETQEIQRPKDPPTPDYNTTQLHLPDNNNNNNSDDTKLNLAGLRNSQEDLRDYRTNNAAWAGYQDRPALQGPPYTDRPGYGGDRSYRSYREAPWSSREASSGYVADPRVGGHHDGIGLGGNRNGGALLFVRFAIGQGENINVAAQAFLKSKTLDTGGRFLGLARKVFDFGYENGPTEGIGVFHFPSIEKGFMFFQMDPILRQPDFPPPSGHSEVWLVNNAYLPDNLKLFSTFLLSEVELHRGKDKREFFETFQKPFENYLYKNGAMPFVICSYGDYDRKSVRRHMYPSTSIVTCHLFQGFDHLNWITNDETYSKFRSLHNQMATEKCSIFNISRDMFP